VFLKGPLADDLWAETHPPVIPMSNDCGGTATADEDQADGAIRTGCAFCRAGTRLNSFASPPFGYPDAHRIHLHDNHTPTCKSCCNNNTGK
jgi:hypothetical protein